MTGGRRRFPSITARPWDRPLRAAAFRALFGRRARGVRVATGEGAVNEPGAVTRAGADVAARREAIMELARAQGRVSVDGLVARFGVTPQTIRKDLNDLAARRLLTRVHGGAVSPSGTANVQYEKRRRIAAAAKAAIGRAAAALIPDDASLFVNIGTTTEAVGEALLDHRGLLVITNNINVANRMRVFPRFEVIIAGGVVRASDGGIVGEATTDFIRQFRVDYAVIGASAIDPDGTLFDFDYREVKVAQAIMANARHVILVADATKFARNAPVRIGHLAEVAMLVTDGAPPQVRAVCEAYAVRLVETGPGTAPDGGAGART
jgi:DeoR family glycerol-3-phosphate regulon repressor